MLETLIAQIIENFDSKKIDTGVYEITQEKEKYVLIITSKQEDTETDMMIISKIG